MIIAIIMFIMIAGIIGYAIVRDISERPKKTGKSGEEIECESENDKTERDEVLTKKPGIGNFFLNQ